MRNVWIVGQSFGAPNSDKWELRGVFSSEEGALNEIEEMDNLAFIVRCDIGSHIGEGGFDGVWYPNIEIDE